MTIMTIKGFSKWTFETYGGGGASFVVSVSGGEIQLSSPTKELNTFHYAGIGGGASWGGKLPKIGKVQLEIPKKGSATVAPTWFPSKGTILATSNCPGADLVRSDFLGPCAFVEAGGGLIAGASGMIMLAGIQGPESMWERILGSALPVLSIYQHLSSARAVIPMAGVNVGIQAGAGIAGLVGYMW